MQLRVFIALLFFACTTYGSTTWTTKSDLVDIIPSVSPTKSTKTENQVACIMICERINCTVVAFNEANGECKAYHIGDLHHLGKMEAATGFKLFYKSGTCPKGWIADWQSQTCFKMGDSAVSRNKAWEFCENSSFSYLATFNSKEQRENVYQFLKLKSSHIQKWWNGYAMFGNRKWPRAVDELAGYHMIPGLCDDGLAFESRSGISFSECKHLCDQNFGSTCVIFEYSYDLEQCNLRQIDCPAPQLGGGWLSFVKTNANRPFVKTTGFGCVADVTVKEQHPTTGMNDPMKCQTFCEESPSDSCVSFTISIGECYRQQQCSDLAAFGPTTHYDRFYIHHPKCPFGYRYRDLCLVPSQQRNTKTEAIFICRAMGGQLGIPFDRKKWEFYSTWSIAKKNNIIVNWSPSAGNTDHGVKYEYLQMWDFDTGDYSSHSTAMIVKGLCEDNTENKTCLMRGNDDADTYYICDLPFGTHPTTCRFTPPGGEFMGNLKVTKSGKSCVSWDGKPGVYFTRLPSYNKSHTNCRNPGASTYGDGVWCYINELQWEECPEVPMCRKSQFRF